MAKFDPPNSRTMAKLIPTQTTSEISHYIDKETQYSNRSKNQPFQLYFGGSTMHEQMQLFDPQALNSNPNQ